MRIFRKLLDVVFFSGLKPVDPLYLSNRSAWQKIRTALLIAVPCGLLIGVLALALSGAFRTKPEAFPKELTRAQVAARMLPGIDRNLSLPANHDLNVVDVHVDHRGPIKLAGKVKNETAHVIRSAEVIFDLVDARGSRLGAVSATIDVVQPQETVPFAVPIVQRTAASALVREIHAPL